NNLLTADCELLLARTSPTRGSRCGVRAVRVGITVDQRVIHRCCPIVVVQLGLWSVRHGPSDKHCIDRSTNCLVVLWAALRPSNRTQQLQALSHVPVWLASCLARHP